MQDIENKTDDVKPKPNAMKWLCEGLQEAAQQRMPEDATEMADMFGLSERRVRQYFRGEAVDYTMGVKILKELRSRIVKRENEVKKLTA